MIKWENKFFEIDEKEEEEEEAILSQFLNEQQQNSKQNNYFECQTKFVNLPVHGCKMALPEGSTSKSSTLCEEIHIPPPIDNNKKFLANFPRLKIDELDEFAQTAFDGIKSLNVIQSQVFDQAYNTLNNLLICAPTGAGKTNIALLTILRTIRDNRTKNGKINKNAFKVIYLAPMKALATEMTSNFSKRLGRLGLKTRELTGDSQLSRKEIQETQVLVLTPEKWDVITRKSDDEELSQLVRLLIIDEVHLLHDDRGPVIEAIIARTLRRIEVFHQNIRIVGLSATLPNYNDVATFLRVESNARTFSF
uniref:Helicase ATP-binding domain-containing protein n=1 Tax=Meloidogyne enterolobii TaxID=390850 RepID=A0A6V7VBM3_MELEN|nr:unnamed protein product [Meloidogyne enterolobii]